MATNSAAGISDAAVQAKTGKTWAEWFALLDAAGAKTMPHRDIAALLAGKHGCSPWWSQMVAVGYERERGLREKHQRPDGYSVSASRTVAVPVAVLFAAWGDDRKRRAWLAEKFTIRKATPGKSLRIAWGEGSTNVEVNFYAKGEAKSQVAVQHDRLAGRDAAAQMKAYWAERLDRLKALLEG